MQPVPNLQPLQFAQVAVNILHQVCNIFTAHLDQRDGCAIISQLIIPLMHMVTLFGPHDRLHVAVEAGFFDQFPNLLLQQRQFGRIGGFELVIFVHQLRQLRQFAIQVGLHHRRHEMIDDDGMSPPFGLCAFPWVVEDERIKEGHIADKGVREALIGKAHPFAGQPFQRAMLADMHNRIGSPTPHQLPARHHTAAIL